MKCRKAVPPQDLNLILKIEEESFNNSWTKKDFIQRLTTRGYHCWVVENRKKLIGYVVYKRHPSFIEILNLAIHPKYRLKGAGRTLVNKLKSKLRKGEIAKIVMLIRETNLDGHLFANKNGFIATSVERNCYSKTNEDGYNFTFRLEWLDDSESIRIISTNNKLN